jgi:hypothetical protein
MSIILRVCKPRIDNPSSSGLCGAARQAQAGIYSVHAGNVGGPSWVFPTQVWLRQGIGRFSQIHFENQNQIQHTYLNTYISTHIS